MRFNRFAGAVKSIIAERWCSALAGMKASYIDGNPSMKLRKLQNKQTHCLSIIMILVLNDFLINLFLDAITIIHHWSAQQIDLTQKKMTTLADVLAQQCTQLP